MNKKTFRDNGLSIVLIILFLGCWVAQALSGNILHNQELHLLGFKELSLMQYLFSGHFWQATGENWESEFLQMGFYVMLTAFLFQRGSAESKDPDEKKKVRNYHLRRSPSFLYRNSLSLAFLLLFTFSFTIHAYGGLIVSNENRISHGLESQQLTEFITSAEFWFQSFQNWQSEFLAVLSIVVLTIFLRQSNSPESKDVDALNSQTGG